MAADEIIKKTLEASIKYKRPYFIAYKIIKHGVNLAITAQEKS
jgi:hypothetical protein